MDPAAVLLPGFSCVAHLYGRNAVQPQKPGSNGHQSRVSNKKIMKRKVLFFINPISGTRNKEKVLLLMEKKALQYGAEFEILHTNMAGQYDYLVPRVSTENITDVVVAGGDGTVNQIVAALKGMKVNIGILPLGSGNGLAFTARIPKSTSRALDLVFTGKASWVDGFNINERFACMLCGMGFDALVAHEFAKQKKRGLMTYARQALLHYMRARPHPFEIHFGSRSISTEAFFISIANSNQFGNQFTIAPRASLNDGLLDIVIVRKMSKALLPFALLRQLKMSRPIREGELYERRNILYFQTSDLSILNSSRAPLHIDGDPAKTADHFSIHVVRNCFRLIQPA